MGTKIAIITGGSSGIGKALVNCYSGNGYLVYSISRSERDELKTGNIEQIMFDLSVVSGIEIMFVDLLDKIDFNTLESITLINNAGTLGKISRIENIEPENINEAVSVNFTAPMILSSLFIKSFRDLEIPKMIINISSSASFKPYYGWSTYCSAKAAMDMMVRVIAIEQETRKNGAKIIAVHPGVVETAMQEQIRKTSEEDFRSVQRFKNLKETNQLISPEEVAEKVFYLTERNNIENGRIINLKDI